MELTDEQLTEVTARLAAVLTAGAREGLCRDPSHREPFACHRQAEGGWVCAAQLELDAIDAGGEPPRRFGTLVDRPTWLEDTARVQRGAYGLEPAGVRYVKEQATAAIVELAEMLQALPWKAGRDGTPGREPTQSEMEHARGELVDVLIFAGNLAVALGFDDGSLWRAVNEKACRNVERRRGTR